MRYSIIHFWPTQDEDMIYWVCKNETHICYAQNNCQCSHPGNQRFIWIIPVIVILTDRLLSCVKLGHSFQELDVFLFDSSELPFSAGLTTFRRIYFLGSRKMIFSSRWQHSSQNSVRFRRMEIMITKILTMKPAQCGRKI